MSDTLTLPRRRWPRSGEQRRDWLLSTLPGAWPTWDEIDRVCRAQLVQQLVAYRPQRTHCVMSTLLAAHAEKRAALQRALDQARAEAYAARLAEIAAHCAAQAKATAVVRAKRQEQVKLAAEARAKAEAAEQAAAARAATEYAEAEQARWLKRRAATEARAAANREALAATRAIWLPVLAAARVRLEAVERRRRAVKVQLEDGYARQGFVVCASVAQGRPCTCGTYPSTQRTLPFRDVEEVVLHREQEIRELRNRWRAWKDL